MTLVPGSRLGPYEITSRIGEGGMGEVYRAQDTRLDRSVAIKVLSAVLSGNAQLRLRFEREARTISQLNHPNICTLHDVGNEDGTGYLVMELLEGETLADRISRGPLPLPEVLRYGAQIAAGLDRAHRAGIIHRDLKPANIMITKSGAKLLDFGLARTSPLQIRHDEETQQKPLTEEGTVLGTFQYMAPEQLEGDTADARTDIFALGVVLYEMATGKRAFDGRTKTSLIAAIVQSDPPPIRTVQPLTPPALEHVVEKCFAKQPDDRWQSVHDVGEELKWIGEAGSQAGVVAPLMARRQSRERLLWAAALLVALGAALVPILRRPEVPRIAMALTAPPHVPVTSFDSAVLSPDGNSVVLVVSTDRGSSLWFRNVADAEPRPLSHTDGASMPFWSPDSRNVGFYADGKLKRLAVAGGPPRTICDAEASSGGTWNRDDVIVFTPFYLGPLYRVSANGGAPVAITKLDKREEAHRWPVFLPDGEHVLFLGDAARTEDHHLKIAALHDRGVKELMQGVTNALYAEPGYLLYTRAGSLLAQPFDAKAQTLSGEPQVLAEQLVERTDGHDHIYEFSVANGRLTYRSASSNRQMAWVDRKGMVIETIGEPRRIGPLQLAPDRRHIAFSQIDADGRGEDIWLMDLTRNVITRLTFDPESDVGPIWSPDGKKIAFMSMRSGLGDLYVADVVNPSNVHRAASAVRGLFPTSWSPDGQFILMDYSENGGYDIWSYSTKTGKAELYLASKFDELGAVVSPDGAWVAYESTESGRSELYVERFPTHESRRQISTAGGQFPIWRPDGKELFYEARSGQLMSVDMTNDASNPAPLFQVAGSMFGSSADGQRLLVVRPIEDLPHTPITFVSNWTSLLKR
jgi:serine/threonine protein kinase